jgi:hypothetical protein
MRDAHMSDLIIIEANAIRLNGETVSIDGLGKRVSSMIFGLKHVLIIVGKNIIVSNIDSAIERIRNTVAPLNYIRHANKHCKIIWLCLVLQIANVFNVVCLKALV